MVWSSSSTEGEPLLLPSGRLAGRLAPPPSKSITNRFLNLAFLSPAETVIENPLLAEDTVLFRAALESAGWRVAADEGVWRLTPAPRPSGCVSLECGNSGTMLRFLAAACAALPGEWRLDGAPRLRQRPIGPLVTALATLGARIEFEAEPGVAPLRIDGGRLRGGAVRLDAGHSSQYLSALLMASLRAGGPVEIAVAALTSAPYVELTLRAISQWGGRVERLAGGGFRVHPSPPVAARSRVEADASSACYAAAGAALTGGRVEIAGLAADSLQGDARFFDLLAAMGAEVRDVAGAVRVQGGDLRGLELDLSAMPDQVPTLAAVAPFARGRTVLRNVAHLRIKESDRLRAMAAALSAAGAVVRERPDGLEIEGLWHGGGAPATAAWIDPCADHRIAMSAALLGLRRPGLTLTDPSVVAKSYPSFWQDWHRLVQR